MSDEVQVPREKVRQAGDLLRLLSDLCHVGSKGIEITHARNLSRELHGYAAEDKKFKGLVQVTRKAVTKVPSIGWSKDRRREAFRKVLDEVEEEFVQADWEHHGQVTFYLTLVKTSD
jgi:hypothetical protein